MNLEQSVCSYDTYLTSDLLCRITGRSTSREWIKTEMEEGSNSLQANFRPYGWVCLIVLPEIKLLVLNCTYIAISAMRNDDNELN